MSLRGQLRQLGYSMTITELRRIKGSAEGELSYHSIMYLDLIDYQSSRGDCTVSLLAKTLRVSKPAVTSKVNELLGQGFLIKTQSELDKRVFHLRLSDAVDQLFRECDGPFECAISQVEREYSPEQIDHFCEILLTLTRQFTEESSHATPSDV